MAGLNAPLVYKTYQDVKNNLIYWTFILICISLAMVYFLFLEQKHRNWLIDLVTKIGSNSLISTLAAAVLIGAITIIAIILISGIEIHDKIYDKLFIKWRDTYDVELILTNLIEPIRTELPKNFKDFARKYKYEFMKPFYEYVGDGKSGIAENTRIRFYERATLYWATQLNEIFIVIFLVWSPVYLIINQDNNVDDRIAFFMLALIVVAFLNRWAIRKTRQEMAQATLDEIEEIISKTNNVKSLKNRYKKLCATYKI